MFVLYFLLLWLPAVFSADKDGKLITCYGYGGWTYPNNTKCPGSNACCGADATCLSNRLCHKPNDGPGTFIRASCANDPYDSGTCAQLCLYNETRGALPRVRICSDGSLCCDDDVRCCDDGKGVFLDVSGVLTDSVPSTTYSYGPERTDATFRMSQSAAELSQSATASHQSTTTVTGAPSSSTANSDDTKGSSNGLKIGLGVAIPIAALLLLGLGFWFWRRKRNAKSQASKQVGGEQSAYEASAQKYELPNTHPPAELDAGYGR